MRQHVKQAALTVRTRTASGPDGAHLAGPFTATTGRKALSGWSGPQFPILIDTNGDGQPTPGDAPANPQPVDGTTLRLTSLFSCNNQNNNVVGLTNQDSAGKYRTVSRTNNFREQSMNITGFTGGGVSAFSYTELDPTRGIRAQGSGVLAGRQRRRHDGHDAQRQHQHGGVAGVHTRQRLRQHPGGAGDDARRAGAAPVVRPRFRRSGCRSPTPTETDGEIGSSSISTATAFPIRSSTRAPRWAPLASPPSTAWGSPLLTLLLGGIGVWYLGRRRLGEAGPAA